MSTTVTGTTIAARDDAQPVIPKHHLLVRVSHWLNIPILLGMILTGLSIYWASPVYTHAPRGPNGNTDYFADIGAWVVRHFPGTGAYKKPDANPGAWVYDHFGLGTGLLASALRLHWLFAYLFMLNGFVYVVGLVLGKGYKALLPRRTDPAEAFQMIRYYLGLLPAKILRRPWPHPVITTKYNALQRGAYFTVPIAGFLSVLTGWAIHKPAQLGWLQALFGGYDYARVWHFWLTWVFVAFVVPHVILVAADGWDTFRSMVTGWSVKSISNEHRNLPPHGRTVRPKK